MVKVTVKWNKQVFPDVDLDPSESVETFRTQLWSMTGVPVDRQKLMAKGGWKGVLKDDADLSTLGLKDGLQVMLMGSAEVVEAPKQQVLFMEDMKQEDLAQSGQVLPAGFVNLGNTCYMNSTLQCFRKVPELRAALTNFSPRPSEYTAQANPAQGFTTAFRDTLNQLDRSLEAVPPMMFLSVLRSLFPQFAQQAPRGGYMQQDAEEFYSALVTTLASSLKEAPQPRPLAAGDVVDYRGTDGKVAAATIVRVHHDDVPPYYTVKIGGAERQTDGSRLTQPAGLPDLGGAANLIDALFGIQMEEELSCEECPEEPKKTSTDLTRKLVCNIQGGAGSTTQVSHLHEGVKLGLLGEVEKHSEILGRNAVWKRTQHIKRLPRYLCVQFMRFFWKATPDSQDHAGVKCKIMKPVTFPNILDIFEFCSDDLKAILKPPRDAAAAEALNVEQQNKRKLEEETKAKGDAKKGTSAKKEGASPAAEAPAAAEGGSSGESMEVDGGEDEQALQQALAMSMNDKPMVDTSAGAAGPGLPANFKGNYELFAVVTHKGRAADGGHYMGWVREEGDKWLVFDDADVSPCATEDIMKLNGGGDWHMAYLTFYRYKD